MNRDSTATEAMVSFRCDYCEAAPGSWCVTSSGHRATFLHSSRWYRWKQSAEADVAPSWPGRPS